jgi:drug/metabolite transporter (DMT)-like permease
MGAAGLMFASASWALGSIFSHRWCKPSTSEEPIAGAMSDPLSASAWQMIFAGVFNLLLAAAFGQTARAQWTAQGLGAIVYLVIFGSWVGYTAYIWLLKHVPTSKVATYAYVNPIIAVFLGWAILGEHVNGYIVAGSIVIIGSVALVNTANVRHQSDTRGKQSELPACEPSAD